MGCISALDVIRSMMREGFSRDEIYDVLAGMGLPGEQVQLMIDRVKMEFDGAGLVARPYRLAAEVEKVFQKAIEDLQHVMLMQMDSFARQLELIKIQLEKLGARVAGIEQIPKPSLGKGRKCLNSKSHKYKVGN